MVAGLLLAIAVCVRADTPPMLKAAEELVQQVAPERTSYKHKEPEVRWSTDPANPAYCHTDCSGLVIALLERCYPQQFGEGAFKRWLDSRRPTARRFYDAIAEGRGFARIGKITDVQVGDLVAIKYQPGGENTGHMMLISGEPKRRATNVDPLIDGTEQWIVPIIDETGSGHGVADTRRNPDGTFRSGLGRGEFRLYTLPDGTIAGYTWSPSAKSKYYGDGERALAIGRFDPAFRP